jgi:methylmalonyl-CoA mutase
MSRIARNNSILLKDESHLGKVSDPLAGTYAIENMTHTLAQAAWKKFQEQI